MIPGQDPQTAGIVGEGFRQPIFGGEISHGGIRLGRGVGVFPGQIGMEALHDSSQTCQIMLIGRYLDEAGLAGELKNPDRIMIRPVPELHIEIPKKLPGRRLPAPPDIVSEFPQGFEGGGEFRNDIVGDDRIHGG